ncbi:MAG: hypothetical protein WKG07_22415 [Hymenobacter sp.]
MRRFVGRHLYRWHRALGLHHAAARHHMDAQRAVAPADVQLVAAGHGPRNRPYPPLRPDALAVSVAQVLSQYHLAAIQNLQRGAVSAAALLSTDRLPRAGCAISAPAPGRNCRAATAPTPKTWPATCWPTPPRPWPAPSG